MTIWSLIYYTIFIFYLFSGLYVWSLNKKAPVNRYFLWTCIALASWSLGFSLSISSSSALEAKLWLPLSTFGWTFFYTPLLFFVLTLSDSPFQPQKFKLTYMLYLAPAIFYWRFVNFNTGNFIQTPYGWIYTLYEKGPWSYAFDLYYASIIIAVFVFLIYWHRTTDSPRERQQAKIIQVSLCGAFIFGAMTDTILPMVGLNILPLGVVFCAIAVLGLWRAITNYKLMYLTQEIAADHVLVTMKDPVIVTNRKYIIGYMNSAAQTMIGQNASNYIGLPLHTILPELIQAHPCYIALDTYGHSSGNTLEFINSTGIKKPHLCSAVNAYTEFGEKIGVVFVLHDISERIAFERQLQDLNMNLTKKISQINHIFDHVHEGIFTFKEDLIVQEEYSHICYTFFGGPIEQSNVCDLLYPDSDKYEDRDFLKSLLNQLFISNDTDRMRYCPLLPEVVVIEHRILELTFQFTIDTTKTPIVMVILSDATERYALQKQLSLEQQTMEMAVKTLRYHNDFTELVHDYMHFAKNAALQYKEHPATFNRSVHTYRGNFAQFSLINLVRFLQQLEQPLYSVTSLDLSSLSYENLMYHLQIDLDTIEKTTGLSPLVKNDSIQVDTKLLDSLETTIRSITTSPLSEILVSKLNQLHYKSMKALLAPLIEYTLLLAKRHQLVINPFTIQGDDLLIDFKYYQPFLKSLTHLFRNIVGHAIESEDERVQLGKSCCGNVSFTVATDDAYMYITLADDGRGIDYKKVKKIALNSGLLREDMSDSISEIELTNYLVKEYFTTEARHSSTSGLGMGLSEVHQDIMKLQGSLTITSVPTQGTTIKIVLPFTHAIHSNEAV